MKSKRLERHFARFYKRPWNLGVLVIAISFFGAPRDEADRIARTCAKLFTAIGLPATLALALFIGPLGVADEPAHFLRAAAVAQGDLLPRVGENDLREKERRAAGAPIEAAAVDFARSEDFDKFHDRSHKASLAKIGEELRRPARSQQKFAAHSNTAIYPPFLYVTPAIAVAVGRIVHAAPILWLYLARLGDALVGCALTAWSIGRARSAAPVLLLFAASPLYLFMMAGVSADALLLPITAVFSAELSRISTRAATSQGDVAVLGVAAVVLGVGKVAYMPLAALAPVAAYLSDREPTHRFWVLLSLFLGGVMLWSLWAIAVQDAVFSMRPDITIDPKAQMSLMLADPISAFERFGTAFDREWSLRIREIVGYKLGWSEFGMPGWFADAYLGCTIAVSLVSTVPIRRSLTVAISAVVAVIICGNAILALLYSQYNAVGADRLVGFQGRYYTPLLMVTLSLMPCVVWQGGRRLLPVTVMGIATFSMVYTLIRVVMRYWI